MSSFKFLRRASINFEIADYWLLSLVPLVKLSIPMTAGSFSSDLLAARSASS